VIFKTRSGSCYELNLTTNQARCLSSPHPTRIGQGIWHRMEDYTVRLGYPAVIMLPDVELLPGSPEEAQPAIITSPVTEISDDLS
jgi:hypothetical protein